VPQLLRMPEVAANTTEAVLASWPLQLGAAFRAHDTIATVETAKAVVDIEAEQDGVLLATLVAEGTEVVIGDPIALFATVGEEVTDIDAALAALGAHRSDPDNGADAKSELALDVPEADREPSTPARELPADVVTGNGRSASPQRVFASPLARRLARDARLPVDEIAGTGPNSRIVRRDVEAAIANRTESIGASQPSGPAGRSGPAGPAGSAHVDHPHTRLRRAIAARLVESTQTAPHFYLRGTARVDALTRLRSDLNEGAPTRVSLTDLIIKAVAHAHVSVPEMNVIWTPDAIRSFAGVDVAVAVATDDGLVTPVLRSVESLSVRAIARATRDLVERSRRGELRQHELEGGSITVTNLGMYDTAEFAAIINPPQSAILAVGAVRDEPVARDGQVGVAPVMRVTLSVDHRPVDGVTAARWLQAFLAVLERPVQLLS
jgi:pyruvate dehydrogenase E2 component (dihydrolipoamide acetyltransferase)